MTTYHSNEAQQVQIEVYHDLHVMIAYSVTAAIKIVNINYEIEITLKHFSQF